MSKRMLNKIMYVCGLISILYLMLAAFSNHMAWGSAVSIGGALGYFMLQTYKGELE